MSSPAGPPVRRPVPVSRVRLLTGAFVLSAFGLALPSARPQIPAPAAPKNLQTPGPLPFPNTQHPTPNTFPPVARLADAPPALKSVSAILVDAESGQVLYELNADARRPMASTTKVMTALLFAEHTREDETVTASVRAAKTKESSLHLKVGEKISAYDMMRAILMRSANDGCVAAAEHVAGSVEAFADLMNDRARALGANATHFANPHGLHDPLHYTTARDLALIARAALREPRVNEVVRLKKVRISRTLNARDVSIRNHSRFLGRFPGADGVKTGWTVPAGKCYVGSATQGGWRLVTVVLKSKDYVNDTRALMKHGFARFQPHVLARPGEPAGVVRVSGGQRAEVAVTPLRPLLVVARRGETPSVTTRLSLDPARAPVEIGATVGRIEAVGPDGGVVSSAPLVALEPVLPALARVEAPARSSRALPFAAAFLLAGLVSLRYGTRKRNRKGLTPLGAAAKGARRRWHRFAPGVREPDRGGARLG